MPDDALIRARRLPDGSIVQVLPDGSTRPFTQQSDWERVDAMTEAEVEANALMDADNPPLTRAELARMRRVGDSE
ncbi:MAG: hypothetical protein QM692_22960 [Thermomicrobiales bacterium]